MTSSPEQGCIFCKIIARELPAKIVYEDKHTIGILDTGQAIGGGTCLVFAKKHVDRFYDLDDEDVAGLFQGVSEVARRIKKALKPIFVGTLAVQQQVKHVHFIVFPNSPKLPVEEAFAKIRRTGAGSGDEPFAQPPQSDPDEIADQIRRA